MFKVEFVFTHRFEIIVTKNNPLPSLSSIYKYTGISYPDQNNFSQ